jgi:DNA-binding NarL/FixJ family response regulator
VNAPVKLLIVDDHQVFAEGLEALFRAEPDFEPMAAVSDPGQVLGVATAHRPDAVIMDVQLGHRNGIELTAQLTAQPAAPVVVVLTAYSDAATAIDAIAAGATGFVSKDGPAEHIVTAVRAAALGGTWLPAGMLGTLLGAAQSPLAKPFTPPLAQLTDKEREVLRLMVNGLDRRGIAARLYRSPDTVKTHFRNIAAKLGTQSATEAVAIALNAGLRPELTPPGRGGCPSPAPRTPSSCLGRRCRSARLPSTRARRTGTRTCCRWAPPRRPRPAHCPAGTCPTAGTTWSIRCPRCRPSGCR